MRTPATVKKHPVHPMLVAVPIGLWIFSLISDVIYLTGLGGAVWAQVALYSMGGGIIGALVAAVPGLIDLLSIRDPKIKRIGIFHMIINLAAVAIFAWNWLLRLHNPSPIGAPLILSVVGIALITVSGWLGGEIVHVYGVSVEDDHPREDTNPPLR